MKGSQDMRLLIATHNRGKKTEYASLLDGLGVELTTLAELGVREVVEENGSTYAENALLKARSYAALTGLSLLSLSFRNFPVYDVEFLMISSGVPFAITLPPSSPPSGPKSMI